MYTLHEENAYMKAFYVAKYKKNDIKYRHLQGFKNVQLCTI